MRPVVGSAANISAGNSWSDDTDKIADLSSVIASSSSCDSAVVQVESSSAGVVVDLEGGVGSTAGVVLESGVEPTAAGLAALEAGVESGELSFGSGCSIPLLTGKGGLYFSSGQCTHEM